MSGHLHGDLGPNPCCNYLAWTCSVVDSASLVPFSSVSLPCAWLCAVLPPQLASVFGPEQQQVCFTLSIAHEHNML